jgi:hypothetical protein
MLKVMGGSGGVVLLVFRSDLDPSVLSSGKKVVWSCLGCGWRDRGLEPWWS